MSAGTFFIVVDRITFRWSIIWPKPFRLQMLFPPYRPKQTVSAEIVAFWFHTTVLCKKTAAAVATSPTVFLLNRVLDAKEW